MTTALEISNLIAQLSGDGQPSRDSQFLRFRFRQMVNRRPRETLDTLFFDCYQAIPGLARFSQLRSFLVPQASHIYPGVASYVERLQPTPGADRCGYQSLITREARYLCREMVTLVLNDDHIPITERQKLHQALHRLKVAPEALWDASSMKEVLDNIYLYLDKADLIAELPQFQPVYFTNDELARFHSLQVPLSSTELEARLDEALIPLRKRHILQVLLHFIRSYPLASFANQGLAVYISLGEVIPWHQHAFIKRLLVVSYQEAEVCRSLQYQRSEAGGRKSK